MAKKKNAGEQLDLIDVAPENAKPIIEAARLYKKAQSVRRKALQEEVDLKEKVLGLVKAAELQPLKDGVIKFNSGGFTFCVTPRDELITITEEKKKKGKKGKKGMKKKVEAEELDFDEKGKKPKEDK